MSDSVESGKRIEKALNLSFAVTLAGMVVIPFVLVELKRDDYWLLFTSMGTGMLGMVNAARLHRQRKNSKSV